MKKILLIAAILIASMNAMGQAGQLWNKYFITGSLSVGKGVGIAGDSAAYADPSAWFEMGKEHTYRGMLLPRVDHVSSIDSPKQGLVAYVYDSSAMCFYNGSVWAKISSSGGGGGTSQNFANTDLTFTGDRYHNIAGHDLMLDSVGNLYINAYTPTSSGGVFQLSPTYGEFSIATDSTLSGVVADATGTLLVTKMYNARTRRIFLPINPDVTGKYIDNDGKPLEYGGRYELNFTDSSLISKRYADSIYTSLQYTDSSIANAPNFANTDLTFTGDRVHDGNEHALMIQGLSSGQLDVNPNNSGGASALSLDGGEAAVTYSVSTGENTYAGGNDTAAYLAATDDLGQIYRFIDVPIGISKRITVSDKSAMPMEYAADYRAALDSLSIPSWEAVVQQSHATASTGTVTNVNLIGINGIDVSGSPITTFGDIILSLGHISPSSIMSTGNISGANLTGTNTGDQTDITGNAGTVTNGVYTTGSYANPAFLTSLAYSKLTGSPTIPTIASTSAVLKGNGSGNAVAATAGTDYQAPITLTTTGTSGAATFTGGTLNVPQYASSAVANDARYHSQLLDNYGSGVAAKFGTAAGSNANDTLYRNGVAAAWIDGTGITTNQLVTFYNAAGAGLGYQYKDASGAVTTNVNMNGGNYLVTCNGGNLRNTNNTATGRQSIEATGNNLIGTSTDDNVNKIQLAATTTVTDTFKLQKVPATATAGSYDVLVRDNLVATTAYKGAIKTASLTALKADSVITATDANTTLSIPALIILPVITANRTLTIPAASTLKGTTITVWDKNTSLTFSWSFTNTVVDASSAPITNLLVSAVYQLESDGTNWFRKN